LFEVPSRPRRRWASTYRDAARPRNPSDRMRRRDFITLVGGAAAWPLAARTQDSDRIRRIGVLMHTGADEPESQARLAAFTQGLQELGCRLAVICGSTIAGAQATTRAYGEMRPSLWPCDRTLSSLVSARPHWHCSRLPAPYQLLWGKRLTLSAIVTFKAFRDRAAISPASFNSSIA